MTSSAQKPETHPRIEQAYRMVERLFAEEFKIPVQIGFVGFVVEGLLMKLREKLIAERLSHLSALELNQFQELLKLLAEEEVKKAGAARSDIRMAELKQMVEEADAKEASRPKLSIVGPVVTPEEPANVVTAEEAPRGEGPKDPASGKPRKGRPRNQK